MVPQKQAGWKRKLHAALTHADVASAMAQATRGEADGPGEGSNGEDGGLAESRGFAAGNTPFQDVASTITMIPGETRSDA